MSCLENYFPSIYNACDDRLQTNDGLWGTLLFIRLVANFTVRSSFPGLRKTTKELSWKIVGNVAVVFGHKF